MLSKARKYVLKKVSSSGSLTSLLNDTVIIDLVVPHLPNSPTSDILLDQIFDISNLSMRPFSTKSLESGMYSCIASDNFMSDENKQLLRKSIEESSYYIIFKLGPKDIKFTKETVEKYFADCIKNCDTPRLFVHFLSNCVHIPTVQVFIDKIPHAPVIIIPIGDIIDLESFVFLRKNSVVEVIAGKIRESLSDERKMPQKTKEWLVESLDKSCFYITLYEDQKEHLFSEQSEFSMKFIKRSVKNNRAPRLFVKFLVDADLTEEVFKHVLIFLDVPHAPFAMVQLKEVYDLYNSTVISIKSSVLLDIVDRNSDIADEIKEWLHQSIKDNCFYITYNDDMGKVRKYRNSVHTENYFVQCFDEHVAPRLFIHFLHSFVSEEDDINTPDHIS